MEYKSLCVSACMSVCVRERECVRVESEQESACAVKTHTLLYSHSHTGISGQPCPIWPHAWHAVITLS